MNQAMAEPATTTPVASESTAPRRDWTGGSFGIVVFLIGVGLLLLTFKLAFDLYSIPPSEALKVPENKPIDLAESLRSFAGVIIRVLLLLVMAAISALVANRGIKLYTDSQGRTGKR